MKGLSRRDRRFLARSLLNMHLILSKMRRLVEEMLSFKECFRNRNFLKVKG